MEEGRAKLGWAYALPPVASCAMLRFGLSAAAVKFATTPPLCVVMPTQFS